MRCMVVKKGQVCSKAGMHDVDPVEAQPHSPCLVLMVGSRAGWRRQSCGYGTRYK